MSFSKTNVELVTLTPELAQEFSTMKHVGGEREVKVSRLRFLKRCLDDKRFAGPTWAVVVDAPTGTRYRLNGQHSSTMLAQLEPEEFPSDLLATIETYTTDSLELDSGALFELFDNPHSVRTNTDIMGFYRAHHDDLIDVDRGFLVAVANGIYRAESEREGGSLRTPRERGLYFKDPAFREFTLWLWSFVDAPQGWMHREAGLVAAMLEHTRRYPTEAREFWRLVLTESHPDPDHETRELSRDLVNIKHRPRYNQDTLRREATKAWKRFLRIRVVGPTLLEPTQPSLLTSVDTEAAPL